MPTARSKRVSEFWVSCLRVDPGRTESVGPGQVLGAWRPEKRECGRPTQGGRRGVWGNMPRGPRALAAEAANNECAASGWPTALGVAGASFYHALGKNPHGLERIGSFCLKFLRPGFVPSPHCQCRRGACLPGRFGWAISGVCAPWASRQNMKAEGRHWVDMGDMSEASRSKPARRLPPPAPGARSLFLIFPLIFFLLIF